MSRQSLKEFLKPKPVSLLDVDSPVHRLLLFILCYVVVKSCDLPYSLHINSSLNYALKQSVVICDTKMWNEMRFVYEGKKSRWVFG
jgi:hypothetical protein